jgi:uncharacterized protein YbjT (DUF2867 family)
VILLTGITGKTGGAIANALLDRGIKFRALARDTEKAAAYAERGVEVVQGDLGDAASVDAALQDCDQAVLILPNSKEQEQLELAFIAAAEKSGVKHFVKLSSPEAVRGTTSPIPLAHIAAEDAIMASGMNWTLVRPSFFMQNLMGSIAGAKATGTLAMPMGNGTVSPTDVKDAGEFFAEVLTQGEVHYGQTYNFCGPEIVNFSQIAEQLSEVLGQDIQYKHADSLAFKEKMRPFLTSDWHSDSVEILFAEIADDTTPGFMTETFEEVVGRKPTSFKAFLRKLG